MQELHADPGVFLRSMASRGALGGLAPATNDVVAALDAAGKDVVIIETVGAGQDEVEVASTALTTVVVVPPATGDDIQAMKAGIIEIADVFVVNKADLRGANAMVIHLESIASYTPMDQRPAPVLRTVASRGEGVAELADAIEAHAAYLRESGRLEAKLRERARHQLLVALRRAVEERALERVAGRLDELSQAIFERRLDPHTAAKEALGDT